MTEPIPVRVTELQEVVEDGRTVRSARIVEYADRQPPAPPARAALPCGEHPYRPECCSPMVGSGMELTWSAPARRALPPAPPAPARRRWWPW